MKTLKDFDCVHCNDKCDGFKCDAYTIHESHALSADVLKQEAIKWVKEDFELVKNKEAHQMLERWKVRFNLTEEDLK